MIYQLFISRDRGGNNNICRVGTSVSVFDAKLNVMAIYASFYGHHTNARRLYPICIQQHTLCLFLSVCTADTSHLPSHTQSQFFYLQFYSLCRKPAIVSSIISSAHKDKGGSHDELYLVMGAYRAKVQKHRPEGRVFVPECCFKFPNLKQKPCFCPIRPHY